GSSSTRWTSRTDTQCGSTSSARTRGGGPSTTAAGLRESRPPASRACAAASVALSTIGSHRASPDREANDQHEGGCSTHPDKECVGGHWRHGSTPDDGNDSVRLRSIARARDRPPPPLPGAEAAARSGIGYSFSHGGLASTRPERT